MRAAPQGDALADGAMPGTNDRRVATLGSSCISTRFIVPELQGRNVVVLSIPDSVRELGDNLFCGCTNVRSVNFGFRSKLERIGKRAFHRTSLKTVSIPDSVIELCDSCFCLCKLRRVTFGASSKLKRIGHGAFFANALDEVSIPASVVKIGDGCFKDNGMCRSVTFCGSSMLEKIGNAAFSSTGIVELSIPDSVRKIGRSCASQAAYLTRLIFGPLS